MSPENKIITDKAIDSVKPDGGLFDYVLIYFLVLILILEYNLLYKFYPREDNKM